MNECLVTVSGGVATEASMSDAPARKSAVCDATGGDLPVSDHDQSELQCLKRRLRELANQLVAACEDARSHLARELHDGVGPELTAARFALASLEPALAGADAWPGNGGHGAFELAQRSLDAACAATRTIVADLHEPQFEGGLVATLSQWVRAFSERTGLSSSFVCAADVRLAQLPANAALAVFRVAQEALNNVAKHANASRAEVRLDSDAHFLTLIVTDNGCGLPRRSRRSAGPAAAGFGLASMQARCEALGGSLRLSARYARKAKAAQAESGATVRARFSWNAMLEAQAGAAATTRAGSREAALTR
ncbi:MAG TPA: ATP-binding protein [Trinickia sp.]|nr:ATP-binding protein [Trinickia sp.]